MRTSNPSRPRAVARLVVIVLATAACMAVAARSRTAEAVESPPTHLLAPVRAVGIRMDTLFLGGYAAGTFAESMRVLASDLSSQERSMVGRHLDRIFSGVVESDGLGRTGRLRITYERSVRPDGSTRAIRVLAAEAAVAGRIHTAYFFEREGKPGYFDPLGRSLDPHAWTGPLAEMHVSSAFGSRRMHPILGRVLPHSGVDYAAAPGTPVRATGDGVVVFAGRRGGYGNLVEVQHPSGYTTRYAHLSWIDPFTTPSSVVQQGDVIGGVGMTGLATGPHLHYEVRRHGTPVDPQRIADGTGIAADVGLDAGWLSSRGQLAALLARTPTMVRVR